MNYRGLNISMPRKGRGVNKAYASADECAVKDLGATVRAQRNQPNSSFPPNDQLRINLAALGRESTVY
ncbi:MAG: hypothetical protein EAZ30_16150 [Betaproteobacteria bacterium]|nr:MAG: hypothetical protein EAZ30_16150 [Betaproteobacteria bacterium]